MSVSDVVVLHKGDEDRAFYVDRFGFSEVPEFLAGRSMEREDHADEAAYRLGDRYISIQRTEEGFDYSIYDEDYHLLDGGVYDNPDMTSQDVLREISEELKQPIYDAAHDRYIHTALQGTIRQSDVPEKIDYDSLIEKTTEAGQAEIASIKSAQDIISDFRSRTERLFDSSRVEGLRLSEIEDFARTRAEAVIADLSLDARVEDAVVVGSRSRGLERPDSDLDVVLAFTGSEREDDFFNTLHEEKIYVGNNGIELDISPINIERSLSLSEYLEKAEKYMEEKSADIQNGKEADISDAVDLSAKIAEKEKQAVKEEVVTFYVAESSEFHSFGELHEGIPRLEDALQVYEKLCKEGRSDSVPALGVNLHKTGTSVNEDLHWDFLAGGRLDLDGLMYMPEMSQNAEVVEALHSIRDTYPEVAVSGHFPDELVTDLATSGPTVQKLEESLAVQIDAFAWGYDPVGYEKAISDRDANVKMIQRDLDSGDKELAINNLCIKQSIMRVNYIIPTPTKFITNDVYIVQFFLGNFYSDFIMVCIYAAIDLQPTLRGCRRYKIYNYFK